MKGEKKYILGENVSVERKTYRSKKRRRKWFSGKREKKNCSYSCLFPLLCLPAASLTQSPNSLSLSRILSQSHSSLFLPTSFHPSLSILFSQNGKQFLLSQTVEVAPGSTSKELVSNRSSRLEVLVNTNRFRFLEKFYDKFLLKR